jgi:RNA polymerase sigma-70 factor, ECF subfamily
LRKTDFLNVWQNIGNVNWFRIIMEERIQIVWKEFHQKLKNFIKSSVKDEDTANDILQDVYIKIQLNISKLEDSTKLTSWVYQIARNTIADHYRKLRPQDDVDLIEVEEAVSEKNYNDIFQNDMRYFIDQLPEKYKEALILTEYNGISQVQLAEHLGISYSGAKSRVQRAKEKLRELFTECCHIQADTFGNIVDYQKRSENCNRC